MKRMKYWELDAKDFDTLKSDYLKIFEKDIKNHTDSKGKQVEGLQPRWERWRQNNASYSKLPKKIEDVLVASFDQLCDYYDEFLKLKIGESDRTELEGIFKYKSGYDSAIAKFFMDNAKLLGIKTCYYCETAYVNTYTTWDSGKQETRRQFDVDHFMPKDKCPLLGLSLFNFVPSCQVCNSRLKSTDVPGALKAEYVKFSPSSKDADFEDSIKVQLRFWTPDDGLRGRYIHFRTKNPYEKYVQFFRLEDRYEFHKVEAVRLNDLKRRYPDTNVRSIARRLHCQQDAVKEDLFHLKYMQEEGRCFEKMTRDILE